MKKPKDMVNYMAINRKIRKSMKKIFLILLFQINLLSAESQSLYQDEFVKVNLSFDTLNENIILQISNISDKTIYLMDYPPNALYHHYVDSHFVFALCLDRHSVNRLTLPPEYMFVIRLLESVNRLTSPPEYMSFRRLLEKESDTIIFNKYIGDSVKIDLDKFKLIMNVEYLPLPKAVYIEDGKYSNYRFLEYIEEQGYKIHGIRKVLDSVE